jgi:hypothetical protein
MGVVSASAEASVPETSGLASLPWLVLSTDSTGLSVAGASGEELSAAVVSSADVGGGAVVVVVVVSVTCSAVVVVTGVVVVVVVSISAGTPWSTGAAGCSTLPTETKSFLFLRQMG